MQLIKLDATPSTNQYLKQLVLKNLIHDYTVVITENQTHGRGQMGASWVSEAGKNLTFSMLKIFENLNASHHVYLNCAVSLALYDTLKDLSVPDLKVKWPNDIMSGNQKLCGILIENILQGNYINKSIIGIGLNVNQLNFGQLQNVSSLQLRLGRPVNLDEILISLINGLKRRLKILSTPKMNSLKEQYEQVLFRKNKVSTFASKTEPLFTGMIKGLSDQGKLLVQIEGGLLKEFALKEVRLLY